ncbi:MAG: acetate uptake transporter [Acidobacteriota bacterium]|nr:acetate uptake transporter [Acidobacteriota bacterium]MDP9121074.1 acetate uptake transporter [Acidobacteriota bacterium]
MSASDPTGLPDLRPATRTANPGPLGLAGFGLTTVVLSAINAGLLPPAALPAVVPLAFAYGGVAQIIAGILEFRAGNTFGMVAFSSYGLFWWWFALLQWTVGAGWLKAPPPAAGGTVLLMWGIFTLLMWLVTFRLNKAVWSIFLLLSLTFFLLAWGDFGHSFGAVPSARVGGYLGLLTGADALFVAFLEVLNATAGRTVVSLGAPLIRD